MDGEGIGFDLNEAERLLEAVNPLERHNLRPVDPYLVSFSEGLRCVGMRLKT